MTIPIKIKNHVVFNTQGVCVKNTQGTRVKNTQGVCVLNTPIL